jgi:hypothetical protein
MELLIRELWFVLGEAGEAAAIPKHQTVWSAGSAIHSNADQGSLVEWSQSDPYQKSIAASHDAVWLLRNLSSAA